MDYIGISGDVSLDMNVQSAVGVYKYNELRDKPKINDVEVSGSKSLDDYGIASKADVADAAASATAAASSATAAASKADTAAASADTAAAAANASVADLRKIMFVRETSGDTDYLTLVDTTGD